MCFQIVVVCYRNNRSKNNYMIQNLRFKNSRFKNSKIHNYWTASLLAMWQSVFIFSTLNSRLIYRASDGEVELAVIVTSGAIHVKSRHIWWPVDSTRADSATPGCISSTYRRRFQPSWYCYKSLV